MEREKKVYAALLLITYYAYYNILAIFTGALTKYKHSLLGTSSQEHIVMQTALSHSHDFRSPGL